MRECRVHPVPLAVKWTKIRNGADCRHGRYCARWARPLPFRQGSKERHLPAPQGGARLGRGRRWIHGGHRGCRGQKPPQGQARKHIPLSPRQDRVPIPEGASWRGADRRRQGTGRTDSLVIENARSPWPQSRKMGSPPPSPGGAPYRSVCPRRQFRPRGNSF